jgi:hypothetical protein
MPEKRSREGHHPRLIPSPTASPSGPSGCAPAPRPLRARRARRPSRTWSDRSPKRVAGSRSETASGIREVARFRRLNRLDCRAIELPKAWESHGDPPAQGVKFARRNTARRPGALYCAVDEARYRAVDCPPRWDLGYLGTHSPDRQPALERLLLEPASRLPDMRFVVAGPQYLRDIEWPANVERVEHLPPANHAAFYAAQRFTLNITRAAMITAGWSPDVCAAGREDRHLFVFPA